MAFWEEKLVACCAVLSMPSGTLKNAWREHRLVVLSEFQGLGIGNKLSEEIAYLYTKDGKKYYSRTMHPAIGEHREKSKLWKATSKNRKIRKDVNNDEMYNNHFVDVVRCAYSHEYIGAS